MNSIKQHHSQNVNRTNILSIMHMKEVNLKSFTYNQNYNLFTISKYISMLIERKNIYNAR